MLTKCCEDKSTAITMRQNIKKAKISEADPLSEQNSQIMCQTPILI